VIVLIGNLVLGVGELAELMAGRGLDGILEGLAQVVRTPDFALWLYLIFAVSNAMLPSPSDMATVRPVLLFLGIATAVVVIAVGIPAIPAQIIDTINDIAGYLAYAFGLTLAADAVFMLLIGLLTLLTRWAQDRAPLNVE
jgi:hypothetical protein